MRGISKPWPPERCLSGRPRGSEPPRGRGRLPGGVAGGSQSRRRLRARNSIGLRKAESSGPSMCREQRSLCIYCERRDRRGLPTRHLGLTTGDPLSRDPRLALHWENLYLSCPRPETCDSAKADHPFRWDAMPAPTYALARGRVGTRTSSASPPAARSTSARMSTLPDAIRQALELAIGGRTDGARSAARNRQPERSGARQGTGGRGPMVSA